MSLGLKIRKVCLAGVPKQISYSTIVNALTVMSLSSNRDPHRHLLLERRLLWVSQFIRAIDLATPADRDGEKDYWRASKMHQVYKENQS